MAIAVIKGIEFDIGDAQCPECSYPVMGYFRDHKLKETDHCAACGWEGYHGIVGLCQLCGGPVLPTVFKIERPTWVAHGECVIKETPRETIVFEN